MPKRTRLPIAFGGSEARAFDEIVDRHRYLPRTLAHALRRPPIAFCQLWPLGKLTACIAAHEGELEGPPGETNNGNEDQLTLEKELGHRRPSVQYVLHDEDVRPALVVGDDQPPLAGRQAFG